MLSRSALSMANAAVDESSRACILLDGLDSVGDLDVSDSVMSACQVGIVVVSQYDDTELKTEVLESGNTYQEVEEAVLTPGDLGSPDNSTGGPITDCTCEADDPDFEACMAACEAESDPQLPSTGGSAFGGFSIIQQSCQSVYASGVSWLESEVGHIHDVSETQAGYMAIAGGAAGLMLYDTSTSNSDPEFAPVHLLGVRLQGG